MSGKSYANISGDLKATYFSNEKLQKAMSVGADWYAGIKHTAVLDGSGRKFALHTGNNRQAVNISEDSTTLPIGDRESLTVFTLSTVPFFHAIKVNWYAIEESGNKDAAFVDELQFEIKNAVLGLKHYISQLGMISLGDAALASVKSTAASAQKDVILKAPLVDGGGYWSSKYIMSAAENTVGDKLIAYRSGSAIGGIMEVASINYSTHTLTMVSNLSAELQAGDTLHRVSAQLATDNSYVKGLIGFRSIANSANPSGAFYTASYFQGVDRTSQVYAQGNRLANSGTLRTITESLLRQAKNYANIKFNRNDLSIDEYRMHEGLYDTIFETLWEDTRINYQKPKDAGMWTKGDFTFDGIPFKWDNEMPYNEIFCPVKKELEFRHTIPIKWVDYGDDGKMRKSDTTPNVIGQLTTKLNQITFLPQCQTVLADISQGTAYRETYMAG